MTRAWDIGRMQTTPWDRECEAFHRPEDQFYVDFVQETVLPKTIPKLPKSFVFFQLILQVGHVDLNPEQKDVFLKIRDAFAHEVKMN